MADTTAETLKESTPTQTSKETKGKSCAKRGGCGCSCLILVLILFVLANSRITTSKPQTNTSDEAEKQSEATDNEAPVESGKSTVDEAEPLLPTQEEEVKLPDFTLLAPTERNGIFRQEVEILSRPESVQALLKVATLISERTTYNGKVYVCFRAKEMPSAGYVYGQVIFEPVQGGLQVQSNELKLPDAAMHQLLTSNEQEIAIIAAKRKRLEAAITTLFEENQREGVYLSFLAVSHQEGDNFAVSFNISAPAASYSRLGADEIDLIRNASLPYPVTEIVVTAKDLAGLRVVKYTPEQGLVRIANGRVMPLE